MPLTLVKLTLITFEHKRLSVNISSFQFNLSFYSKPASIVKANSNVRIFTVIM